MDGQEDVDPTLERVWFPTVVVTVPDGTVVSATDSAHAVLGRPWGTLVGQRVDDVLAGSPSGGLDLVARGHLAGYELERRADHGGEPMTIWVRAVSVPGRTLAVAFTLPRPTDGADRSLPLLAAKATGVGALRADGVITWVSPEAEDLLARPSGHLVGRKLTEFVAPQLFAWLRRLTDAALHEGRVASHPIQITLPGHGDRPVQLLVLPGDGLGSAVFLLVPGRPVDAAGPGSSARVYPALAQLSTREGDIVLALAAGDRVPAIAQKLSLSQGTVRNYLSAIFRKLGVSTQQELIERLRRD